MAKKEDSFGLSPTVTRIINEFSASLHADETIDNALVNRVEQLLATGKVPKPPVIKSTLFETDKDVEP